ncbi:MAG: NAD(P)/FAD-dependent oxidoreductase [Saprospiraceae bacterium]|nr:NAD(P)/FAD-dependent oxidoreductase [Saprospiraceae bacterium]
MQRINLPEIGKPRIVIVGGGFGGINLAKHLAKRDVQVVLLDKNNYHQFQPLFYQVAMSGLEPSSICFPLRKIFSNYTNVYVRVCDVKEVDTLNQKLLTNAGHVNYDYLVIATGAGNFYYGNKNFSKFSLPLKSVSEAISMRNRIIEDFELAVLEDNADKRQYLLDIVIVGAGPTGVELAGALAELRDHVLPNDYKELNFRSMDIHLVQSTDRVLNAMSNKASAKALKNLIDMDVKVHLNSRVMELDESGVVLQNGVKILAKKVIWAAGIIATPIKGLENFIDQKSRRIFVDEFLKVKSQTNVFAIGDVAQLEAGGSLPQVAPMAIQQGEYLAKSLWMQIKGESTTPFRYLDKGSLATIGRNKAVAEKGNLFMSGFAAWSMWLGVHIYFLIGAKKKLQVLFNWFWSYLFFDQGLRLWIKPFQTMENEQSK